MLRVFSEDVHYILGSTFGNATCHYAMPTRFQNGKLKKIEPQLTNDVLKVFDLKNSVNSKKSYGGTSFDNIKKMIMKYKKQK